MKTDPFQKKFDRTGHTCPWWLAYTFDNPLRRLFHKPDDIFRGMIVPGQTTMDIGCGMGYFTLAMARLVGPEGRVIAVDLQEQMLQRVKKRAEQAGLGSRIRLHQCGPDSLGIQDAADFVLAFWMVHEVRDRAHFLQEVRGLLKPQALFLVVEPKMHVTASNVQRTVELARAAGLEPCGQPRVRLSRAILFKRSDNVG